MASTTKRRAAALPGKEYNFPKLPGVTGTTACKVIPEFGMFIDTHRDQPHVGTFDPDIHRGWCKPTPVEYIVPPPTMPGHLGWVMRPGDRTKIIAVDPKHRFVTAEWWETFFTEWVLDHGESPLSTIGDTAGMLPTSRLRDARKKVYLLKSLRQMIREAETRAATTAATAKTKGLSGKVHPLLRARPTKKLAGTPAAK